MDDKEEKNLIEKMVDKVNDVVENIANTASDAAAHMMESDANNMSAQPLIPVAAATCPGCQEEAIGSKKSRRGEARFKPLGSHHANL